MTRVSSMRAYLAIFGLLVATSATVNAARVPPHLVHCEAPLRTIGNGICDYAANNELCGYDGGDCCEESCQDGEFECRWSSFDCRDPEFSGSEKEESLPVDEGVEKAEPRILPVRGPDGRGPPRPVSKRNRDRHEHPFQRPSGHRDSEDDFHSHHHDEEGRHHASHHHPSHHHASHKSKGGQVHFGNHFKKMLIVPVVIIVAMVFTVLALTDGRVCSCLRRSSSGSGSGSIQSRAQDETEREVFFVGQPIEIDAGAQGQQPLLANGAPPA